MGYTTDKFFGYIQDGIRITDVGGEELCNFIINDLQSETQYRGIPVRINKTTVRSGGVVFGTICPLIEISHPTEKYSMIGIMVNGNILSFPFLSLSNQMVKARARKSGVINSQRSFLTQQFLKGDMAKVQQEDYWHAQILDCVNALFSR